MNSWIVFSLGLVIGGLIGVVMMCLCIVSADESRREEWRDNQS